MYQFLVCIPVSYARANFINACHLPIYVSVFLCVPVFNKRTSSYICAVYFMLISFIYACKFLMLTCVRVSYVCQFLALNS
jgi:hypothetical protein